ncbi:hypothetical protein VTK56DRAFT_5024 [Thermocarpiscus australiensis]
MAGLTVHRELNILHWFRTILSWTLHSYNSHEVSGDPAVITASRRTCNRPGCGPYLASALQSSLLEYSAIDNPRISWLLLNHASRLRIWEGAKPVFEFKPSLFLSSDKDCSDCSQILRSPSE